MVNTDSSITTLSEFFQSGVSLYTYMIYGYEGYKSKNYTDPLTIESFYVKAAPNINQRKYFLIEVPAKLPSSVLLNLAMVLENVLRRIYKNKKYTHKQILDGFIFFIDIYLRKVKHQGDLKIFKSEKAIIFYDFIYGYRHYFNSKLFYFFTNLSGTEIMDVMLDYRNIYKDKKFFIYLKQKCKNGSIINIEDFERGIISFLFKEMGDVPAYIKLRPELYALLKCYTISALKNILFGRTKITYKNGYDLIVDCENLFQTNIFTKRYTSYAALKRLHDDENKRQLLINNPDMLCTFEWKNELVELIDLVTEGTWYPATSGLQLGERARHNRHCIGGISYFNKTFSPPAQDPNRRLKTIIVKSLILLCDDELCGVNAEAELKLYFSDKSKKKKEKQQVYFMEEVQLENYKCISGEVIQCRTEYNHGYPPFKLQELIEAFIGISADLFVPVKKDAPELQLSPLATTA